MCIEVGVLELNEAVRSAALLLLVVAVVGGVAGSGFAEVARLAYRWGRLLRRQRARAAR